MGIDAGYAADAERSARRATDALAGEFRADAAAEWNSGLSELGGAVWTAARFCLERGAEQAGLRGGGGGIVRREFESGSGPAVSSAGVLPVGGFGEWGLWRWIGR